MPVPPDPERAEPGVPERAGERFLARWSRLKRQEAGPEVLPAESTEEAPAHARGHGQTPSGQPLPVTSRGARWAALGDADMPALEALDEHSDYRGFLAPRVSEDLRRQALRKLFHSPQFNVVDELTDYWEDYSHFEPLGEIVTQDMRRMFEREAARLAAAARQALDAAEAQAGGEASVAALPGAEPRSPGGQGQGGCAPDQLAEAGHEAPKSTAGGSA